MTAAMCQACIKPHCAYGQCVLHLLAWLGSCKDHLLHLNASSETTLSLCVCTTDCMCGARIRGLQLLTCPLCMQIAGRKTSFNVLLTSYDFMMGKNDRPRLAKLAWEYIIIDEGHRLKNAGCKLNAEIKMYNAGSRLLLTGDMALLGSIPLL